MNKDPFTHLIIGKAMETHHALGPGLVEKFYHQDLVARLVASGVEHESKPRRDLVYRGHVADAFEPDLVFPKRLIPELKALRGEFDPSHFTQLLTYQKFWGIPTGMLFDFGKASLVFKRVAYTPVAADFPSVTVPNVVEKGDFGRTLLNLLQRTFADHGLGYPETTWNGLVSAALRAEEIAHRVNPMARITDLGVAALRCIEVEKICALSITALGDGVSATDRATLETCLRWLGLPWGIAIHFGRRSVDVRFVLAPSGKDSPQIRESADEDLKA